jgi:anti-anti-sigma regulatory factor
MDFVLTQDGTPQIALPPVVDLAYAPTLKTTLVAALDRQSGLDIDAGAVQRITTPCLQILAAAAKSFEKCGARLTISKKSAGFCEAASVLGVLWVFGGKGE